MYGGKGASLAQLQFHKQPMIQVNNAGGRCTPCKDEVIVRRDFATHVMGLTKPHGHLWPRATWRRTYNDVTNELIIQESDVHQTVPNHTRTEIAITGQYNRVLIEYCCGPDSKLGQFTRASRG